MQEALAQYTGQLELLSESVGRRLLGRLAHGPMRATEAAEACGLNVVNTNKWLRGLRMSGLATTVRDSHELIYRLNRPALAALAADLMRLAADPTPVAPTLSVATDREAV